MYRISHYSEPLPGRPSPGGGSFDILAIGMNVQIRGIPELVQSLATLPAQVYQRAERGIFRATAVVRKDAIRNAPRSPTMAQAAQARRKTRKDTSKRKQATAFTRAKPGGLMRSISMSVDKVKLEGSVFVAANSEAGKYAKRIHDEKGKSWHKRGPGTVAKGAHADDKFIERALEGNRAAIDQIVLHELGKVRL